MQGCPLQSIPLLISSEIVQTIHLNAGIAVPATATRARGIALESTGKMYVCASATSFAYVGGMRVRQDGAVVVTGNAPTIFLGGIGFTDDGKLSAVAAGTVTDRNSGIPMVSGQVRVSTL